MKKGMMHALIYYAICALLFAVLSIAFKQPAHIPGLNFLFLFAILVAGFCLIIINLFRIWNKKNGSYNFGALLINLIFVVTIVSVYLVGYYRQFE
jgi:hypothetical protein